MADESLQQLIGQAMSLAGDHPCAVLGHDWKSYGGRACPRNSDGGGRCSQTAYRCARCGEEDYGDPGGPAYRECITEGPCDPSCEPDDDEPMDDATRYALGAM